MTKTLTEQWREGTLKSGHYYIRSGFGTYVETRYLCESFFEGNIEVLSAVPSYDEYKQLVSKTDKLEKKLEIALEVLGIIAMHSKDPVDAVQAACAISQIKEMEGVK